MVSLVSFTGTPPAKKKKIKKSLKTLFDHIFIYFISLSIPRATPPPFLSSLID